MSSIYVAQLLAPLALVLWLAIAPPRSRFAWTAQTVGSIMAFAALARVGIWLFPPWWTPHVAGVLLIATAIWSWRRTTPPVWWPSGFGQWVVAALFVLLGVVSGVCGARALRGGRLPSQPAVAVAWPLYGGTFLVANGGNDGLINSHLESRGSSDPRFLPWRGNAWALDLVAIGGFGARATGFMPTDPARYLIFGLPVLAPCAGTVVQAVDGLPDMAVPDFDRQHLAGNHVVLACGEVHVIVAHLRNGSVRVRATDTVQRSQVLGEVGNSGGTNEPHLHIHAQRPGPPGVPLGGDPLPMTFAGRFLVRGDRIDLP